jgi:hypothetical protein
MKLDMGRAWNDAMALLRGNQQVVLIVAAVFFFLPNLALMLLMPETMTQAETQVAGDADLGAAIRTAGVLYQEIWWQLTLISILSAIGMLGLLALLTDRARPTVGEALKTGIVCLLPYIGAQLLIGFIFVAIVLVVLVVAGAAGAAAGAIVGLLAAVAAIYILTKFSLTVPVIVIEGVMNPVRALGRSWSLTKGNSVRLFLFFLLLLLAFIVIAIVIGIAGAVVGFVAGEAATVFVSALINALTNMAGITLYLAVLAAVHRQLSGGSPQALGETFE